MMDQMSPARRGVFHYVMGYTSGVEAAAGASRAASTERCRQSAHELGWPRSQPPTCRTSRTAKLLSQLMNYAYRLGLSVIFDGRNFRISTITAWRRTPSIRPTSISAGARIVLSYKARLRDGECRLERDGLRAGEHSVRHANINQGAIANHARGRRPPDQRAASKALHR
jgi:hypothetical protein